MDMVDNHGGQHRDGGQQIHGEYSEEFWLLEVATRHFGTNGPQLAPIDPVWPKLAPIDPDSPDASRFALIGLEWSR
jgi:hypothetical protein